MVNTFATPEKKGMLVAEAGEFKNAFSYVWFFDAPSVIKSRTMEKRPLKNNKNG
jgi:hypothetical protein